MFISFVRQKFLATLILQHNILICIKFVFKDTARPGMYILHYSPPPGGGGIRMKKNRCVAREWDSEAVGRGFYKTFRRGKKCYDLGQRLKSFKTLRCGTNMKLKSWMLKFVWLWMPHIWFYFLFSCHKCALKNLPQNQKMWHQNSFSVPSLKKIIWSMKLFTIFVHFMFVGLW